MRVNVKGCQADPGGAALVGLLSELPGDVRQWVCDNGRIIKESDYELASIVNVGGEDYFLKLYCYKSVWRRILPSIGLRRPMVAYEVGRKMSQAGLPVPSPMACFRVPEGVVLLTQAVPAAADLADIWTTCAEDKKAALLFDAATTIADMHGAGFAHGDCKWRNLLVSDAGFCLVDLDAARPVPVHSRAQARDLARFTVDAEEAFLAPVLYEQFFETYANATDWAAQDLRRRTRPLLEKFRRRHLASYSRDSTALL